MGNSPPPQDGQADVPPALEAICLKAMALRPEDRYASAPRVADDIEHWLADEPVAAYREPSLPASVAGLVVIGRWSPGRPSLLVTAVVLLTVGILAVQRESMHGAGERRPGGGAGGGGERAESAGRPDAMSSQILWTNGEPGSRPGPDRRAETLPSQGTRSV